jgi:hypothetical protein
MPEDEDFGRGHSDSKSVVALFRVYDVELAQDLEVK